MFNFKRKFSFGIIYRFLTTAILFITTLSIGRFLGPEKLGEYALIQAIFLLFQTFLIGGSDTLVSLEFSLSNFHSPNLKNSIIIRFLLLIVSILIIIAFDLLTYRYLYIIVIVLFLQIFNYVESYYYCRDKIFLFFKIWLLVTVPIFFTKIIVINLTEDVSFKFIFDGLELCVLLAVFFFLNKNKIRIVDLYSSSSFDDFKTFFRSWLPLWMNAIFLIIYTRVDQFFIHHYFGNASLGVYSASLQLTSLILIPISAVSIQMFPELVRIQGSDQLRFENMISNLTYKFVIANVIWLLFLFFFGIELFNFVYGDEYDFDRINILLISIGLIFNSTGMIAGQVALINKSFWLPISRSILGLIISVLSSVILLPQLSIRGAAVGFMITSIVTNFLSYLFFNQGRLIFIMQTSWITRRKYGLHS